MWEHEHRKKSLYEVVNVISIFRKTEYMEYDNYKKLVDRLDDIYFMNYVAKRNMKAQI